MQPEVRSCARCGGSFEIRFTRQLRQRWCSTSCSALSRPQRDAVARFWKKVERGEEDACWLWIASGQTSGYGSFFFRGRLDRAHRVAWILSRGPIPPDLFVLHRCDNPRCVNPDHLFLGTNTDNVRDMVRKGRHGEGKLSPQMIGTIRIDPRRHRIIAADYGVSRALISAIKRGETWASA